MLLQPQRPTQARTTGSGIGSSTSTHKNSSMASFTSSSHDEAFDASSSSHRQSGSSRGHHTQPPKQQSYFSSPHSSSLPLDGSSDVEYSKYGTAPRRTKKQSAASHGSRMTAKSSSSNSDVGTLRGLGRKLFNRSTLNLKAAPLLASRSQSASSSSTTQSPPLTPTTPPQQQVQPVWLPNGQKDFFSNFAGLPSDISVLDVKEVAMTGVNPKARQEGFLSDSEGEYGRNSISRDAGGSSFSHASPSFVSIPSVGHSASPSAFASGAVGARRDIPAVIEEEGDSDFLRAVLNFGEGGEDGLLSSPSFRGGRAAPLPTRSSSLGQIAGATSSRSASSFATPSPRVPPKRAADGRVILTQEAAKDFAVEKEKPSYVTMHKKYRKGLFGATESESEDEYGTDGDEDDGDITATSLPRSASASQNQQAEAVKESAVKFPSSFVRSPRTRSPTNEAESNTPRPTGLDSAAKKALYNCTLLKVHQHLASTLASDPSHRSLIPAIYSGETLYETKDLRFPRSINSADKLRQHSSIHNFSRNLHVALARTELMRKLRRDKLPIEQEVEISWFQRRYGSTSISVEMVGKALKQRQMVSPEALAKPTIGAPSGVVAGAVGGRRGSGEKNGIVSWAERRSFEERAMVLFPVEGVEVGEVLIEGARVGMTARGRIGGVPAVGYSPRIRVLAGLPTMEEERRMRYPEVITRKSRPRDMQSKRASTVSVSEGGVWEGPARNGKTSRESLLASPSQKQKRLAPWLTPSPQQPQLLSPRLTAQPRTARAASEGQAQTAFVTTHRNSSTASIPEVNEVVEEPKSTTEEKSGDSSDEEVPLAQLQVFRAQRAFEKERIQKLESELAMLRQKDQERGREEEERKAREEEARRIDAERAYEECKAAVEAKRLEKNRKILQEARDRRGFTRQSVLLAEPNYGAGNPLLAHSRPTVKQGASLSSSSSPNLTMDPPTSSRAAQQSTALAKLQDNPLASRSATSLYIQQEGQRRSRTSVIVSPEAKAAVTPMASPRVKPSPTMPTAQMEIQRQYSMASLAHRASMAIFPVSPQITQRQTSLLPPQPLHHTTSMQHLSQLPSSPNMLAASPTGFLQPLQPAAMDPRHPMSMTNLHAQVYMHQQQMQMGMGMGMVQKPGMAQTAKVSSSSRPPLQP